MSSELKTQINSNMLQEINLIYEEMEKLNSKKDIATLFLESLNKHIQLKFLSFVENKDESLKVICQLGDSSHILHLFNEEMSKRIFDWVVSQKKVAALTLGGDKQFIFIPLMDRSFVHGMVVIHTEPGFVFGKNTNLFVELLSKIVLMHMTKLIKNYDSEKYLRLKEQIKSELELTAKLQKSISGAESSKRLLFSVLEDDCSAFNGNIWWVSELGSDISLVFFAQIICKGAPAAMLGGFLLGEMNSLKTKAEICLQPKEVLKYLNQQFNSVFKSTGITFNAWYGVFNTGARKVRFANANHPDPFLIGPEQQVSNLIAGEKNEPLGINISSAFGETESHIASGSKLIICTKDLLEQAAKVGNKYDPKWLPQVLETLGSLSLPEMRNSLSSILSENHDGTALKSSRLALLLEIPA